VNIFNRFIKHKTQGPQEADELGNDERLMIQGIVRLSDTMVREVMVHRLDVDFIHAGTPPDELYRMVRETGHSRYPVFRDSLDNVIGILYVKDLFHAVSDGREFELDAMLRKPYFVPDTKRLDSLLREFKRRRVHIAVAVDEYGGVSGVVCLENIIEEIVGDIQDEFDDEDDDIAPLGDHTHRCDARVNIAELNERLGTALPDDAFDTLGGFVFDLFGKVPVVGDRTGYGAVDFTILEIEGTQIKSISLKTPVPGGSHE
jgi:CBS domain containing-hemolysin-like protein